MKDIREERRKEMAPKAIWPCVLRIVPSCIFNKKDPIILGVDVVEGSVRLGTPICVPSKGQMLLGKVGGIEVQHKPVDIAKKGQQIAVRIEGSQGDQAKTAGKHFVESDTLVSMISRTSIDILKETFRDEVSKEEWLLIKKLKPMLNID
jgi:translation initiation factor 5B